MHNSHRAELSIAIALTLVAAGPRFYRLGALGFYGDEDLSVLAARAVVDGQGSRIRRRPTSTRFGACVAAR